MAVETTTGTGSPLRGGPEPSINPNPNVENLVVYERLSTKTRAGAAISIPADYDFGEAIELRYSSALSNTQFQGLFLRVDTSVANSSTVRGAEISARRSEDVAVGTIEGVNVAAFTDEGSAAITNLFGFTGEAQTDGDYTGTITVAAALRGKFQAEDGATYTKAYAVLSEHEAVTGAKLIDAAFGAKSGAGAAYAQVIDSREATLETINTNQVRLMAFKDAAGTDKQLVYDPDNATVVAVANWA